MPNIRVSTTPTHSVVSLAPVRCTLMPGIKTIWENKTRVIGLPGKGDAGRDRGRCLRSLWQHEYNTLRGRSVRSVTCVSVKIQPPYTKEKIFMIPSIHI